MEQPWADSLRSLTDYTYAEADSSRSLIEIIRDWFINYLLQVLDGTANSPEDWFTYGFILLAIGVSIYLLRRDGASLPFATRGRSLARTVSISEDDTVDLLDAVREAETRGDHTGALRLAYLLTLQRLADAGAITWRPDTADSVYLSQMRDHVHGATFRSAIGIFRRVWYGGAPLDEELYRNTRNDLFRCCGQEVPS